MNNNVFRGKGWWIFAGVVVLFLLWCVGSYNGFVRGAQAVDTQWGQVEVQYQRRVDLIPNLVNSVKGIFNQEKEVFGALAEARTRYSGAQGTEAKAAAANALEGALGRLLVVVENYPQLRSAENVKGLMDELAGTENRVSVERRRYNDLVGSYNVSVNSFPGALFAKLFGFGPRTLFVAQTGAEKAPVVNL